MPKTTPQIRLPARLLGALIAGAAYSYLNHQLAEALLLGAAAEVKLTGQWNDDRMTQVKKPSRGSAWWGGGNIAPLRRLRAA